MLQSVYLQSLLDFSDGVLRTWPLDAPHAVPDILFVCLLLAL